MEDGARSAGKFEVVVAPYGASDLQGFCWRASGSNHLHGPFPTRADAQRDAEQVFALGGPHELELRNERDARRRGGLLP